MGAGAQGLEASSAAFQGHSQGAGGKVEPPECKMVPIQDANTTGGGPPHYPTVPASVLLPFFKKISGTVKSFITQVFDLSSLSIAIMLTER